MTKSIFIERKYASVMELLDEREGWASAETLRSSCRFVGVYGVPGVLSDLEVKGLVVRGDGENAGKHKSSGKPWHGIEDEVLRVVDEYCGELGISLTEIVDIIGVRRQVVTPAMAKLVKSGKVYMSGKSFALYATHCRITREHDIYETAKAISENKGLNADEHMALSRIMVPGRFRRARNALVDVGLVLRSRSCYGSDRLRDILEDIKEGEGCACRRFIKKVDI